MVSISKCINLLLYFFQGELVVVPHPKELSCLLILLRRNMNRTVIMMGETFGNMGSVSLVGLDFLLSNQHWHGGGVRITHFTL